MRVFDRDAVAAPPGPGPFASIAFARALGDGTVLDYLASLARRYGPVTSFALGPQRIVFVDDPGLVEEILVTRQHEFERDTGATLLRELVGEGLLTTDDPAHLRRRRTMQPAFHRNRVAAYATTIVAETERVAAGWDLARPLDLGAEMARVALAAVGATLFGADLRSEAAAVAEVLASVTERGGSLAALLAFAAPALGTLRRAFPRRASLLFPRERARLEAIVAPLVARARAREGGDDLLALLLEARDDRGGTLDDAAIRNEVCMLVLAGHETTANALVWTWYCLSEDPASEARFYAEIDAVLGGRAPTLDDLARLPYVAHVFEEALRLYPPAAAFARRPVRALELGGYAIPRGASVFVSPYVTQRSERFFREPLAFEPARWERPSHPKFAHFPFGGGSKTCIGEPFARLEAILVLATLGARYRFERVERAPIAPSARALLRPARALVVRARRREPLNASVHPP
ncbi:MAG: cytochrome P450 [Vulcanimicrobiaceae bacterium]